MQPEMREQIVAEAKTWLGTPWMHRQCLKGVGVDCALFIRAVFIAVGLVPEFPVAPYPEQWALHRSEEKFLATLADYGRRTGSRAPGNVIVWKFGRCYSHGAIIADWPQIIHAHRPQRAVVCGEAGHDGLAERPSLMFEVG